MRRQVVVGSVLALLPLAACSGPAGVDSEVELAPAAAAVAVEPAVHEPLDAQDPAYDVAVSDPQVDAVYPDLGDPVLDALHYDLALAWQPATSTLTGREQVAFRAAVTSDTVRLDLSPDLVVSMVRLDGTDVEFDQRGADLVVRADVTADQRYLLAVDYEGQPLPVPAPTTRSDYSTNGWTVADDGSVWTMQEPSGAYSWYAVDDQPADKALYDITVSAPSPLRSVANGEQVSEEETDGVTTSHWRLPQPAASYLVTVAIGDYVDDETTTKDGLPMSSWALKDDADHLVDLSVAAKGLSWLERKLGPYPFDSLGFLVVDSDSGMETQTMITLGNGNPDYILSPPVLVHEMAHQWYGDLVTPGDWRDLWMNEGMAMYLQGIWQSQHDYYSLDDLIGYWAQQSPDLLREAGPVADYDPATFGESNVYYVPAIMWHTLRGRLGDRLFWKLVRGWPQSQAYGNAGYDDMVAYFSEGAGQDLSGFFDSWLRTDTMPAVS